MADSHYPSEVASQWAAKNGGQAVNWAASLPETIREGSLVPALYHWSQADTLSSGSSVLQLSIGLLPCGRYASVLASLRSWNITAPPPPT
ncbi:MAG: hypothetical protein EOP86_06405, partial [Verrucomicrobiaceae bacterium]